MSHLYFTAVFSILTTRIRSQQRRRFRRPAPGPADLLAIPPHDRGRRFETDADPAALVDTGALGGNAVARHSSAVNTGGILRPLRQVCLQAMQFLVLNLSRPQACNFPLHTRDRYLACRQPNVQTLWREEALEESATPADELAAEGDDDGAVTWRRITDAIGQLAKHNTARAGPQARPDDPRGGLTPVQIPPCLRLSAIKSRRSPHAQTHETCPTQTFEKPADRPRLARARGTVRGLPFGTVCLPTPTN